MKNSDQTQPTPSALIPAAGSALFTVTGYAMVPVEISITVPARDESHALEEAERLFRESPANRAFYIVHNSEDESAVHDFRASSVKPNT